MAVTLALGPTAAAASPLGALTAQSVRGEPLRALLALGASAPREASGGVRIASPGAYERFGFVRDPALAAARLRAVSEPDGKRFLWIETDAPIASAELVLLLEADGGWRLYRLDLGSDEPADRVNVRGLEPVARRASAEPATARLGAPAGAQRPGAGVRALPPGPDAAAEPVRTVLDGTTPGKAASDAAEPPPPIAPQARPDAVTAPEGGDLDTLARALRPPGATLEQSAAALLRANGAGFVGRPPRPIAGALLEVPPEAAVLAIPQAEARSVLAALAAQPMTMTATATGAPVSPVSPVSPVRSAEVAREPGGPPASRAPRPQVAALSAALSAARARGDGPMPPTRMAPSRTDPEFDAGLVALNSRIAELQRRTAALRAGFEANAAREEALLRALIATTRRAAAATVAATSPR
jgi:hypothetical protein